MWLNLRQDIEGETAAAPAWRPFEIMAYLGRLVTLRNANDLRACGYCGEPFEKLDTRRKYCSPPCALLGGQTNRRKYYYKVSGAKRKHNYCENCAKSLKTKNINAKFCSRACAERLKRKIRRLNAKN